MSDVRYWHLADMPFALHMSANDPKRTSADFAECLDRRVLIVEQFTNTLAANHKTDLVQSF